MGVDVSVSESRIFGVFILEDVQVDDDHADGLTNLRSGKTHTRRGVERLKHIADELVQSWIIGGDVLGNFSQYRLPISINR